MTVGADITLEHAVERLAARDATLFADPGIASDRLGWLGLAAEAAGTLRDVQCLARDLAPGITDVVLLGMGGSSLAPLVLARVIGPAPDAPAMHVLDTTDPGVVTELMARLVPETTLVIVSSKSGTSVEPLSLAAIFRQWVAAAQGAETGQHFIAITDPGSPLEDHARAEGYARIVHAPSDVGGRFAALTPFALVPGALLGIDLQRLVAFARTVEAACHRPGDRNPGQALASWLLDAYAAGRDKLTLAFSASFEPLGLWIEQLVAESTGKDGAGILPVLETPTGPGARGADRMTFVLRTPDDADLASLGARLPAGEPLFETVVDDVHAIGAQFVLWEWAIALFCAVAGIEPFDQPDVEAAKAAARTIVTGGHPATCAEIADGPFVAQACIGRTPSGLADALQGLLGAAQPGSFLALLAYLPEDDEALGEVEAACARIAAARRIPLVVGSGPRYLHSTGQYHKGGPNGGLFLLLTVRDDTDIAIPGEQFTLAELHRAQSAGDLAALAAKGRSVVSVQLPDRSLETLDAFIAHLDPLSSKNA